MPCLRLGIAILLLPCSRDKPVRRCRGDAAACLLLKAVPDRDLVAERKLPMKQ
jgi:hypothetical protein